MISCGPPPVRRGEAEAQEAQRRWLWHGRMYGKQLTRLIQRSELSADLVHYNCSKMRRPLHTREVWAHYGGQLVRHRRNVLEELPPVWLMPVTRVKICECASGWAWTLSCFRRTLPFPRHELLAQSGSAIVSRDASTVQNGTLSSESSRVSVRYDPRKSTGVHGSIR